jgi:hypothetical protein
MTKVDMSPRAVSARLRAVSECSDLDSSRRLDAKINLSPNAISERLATVSALRDLCLYLGRAGAKAESEER